MVLLVWPGHRDRSRGSRLKYGCLVVLGERGAKMLRGEHAHSGVGALGTAARHLRGLVGRAREAGLAVVLATQGLTDLEAVDRALVHRAAVAAHRWRVTVAGCQVGRHSERGCSPAGRLRPNGVPARARGEHAP